MTKPARFDVLASNVTVASPQSTIVHADQAVGKVSAVLLPDMQRLFDRRLVLELEVTGVEQAGYRSDDVVLP